MKRIAWILLIGLWCVPLAMAQIGNFTQRGKATQELKADGISIAHPSLPLNSKATITNTKTGRSVEATVIGRVPASASRIADLSSGAWQELDLDTNSEITISTVPPPRPRVAATPTPPPDGTAVAQATPPPDNTPAVTPPAAVQNSYGENQNPIRITLHNYITLPEELGFHPLSGPRPATAVPQQTTQRYVPDPDLQRRLTATAAYSRSQPLYPTPVSVPGTPIQVAPPNPPSAPAPATPIPVAPPPAPAAPPNPPLAPPSPPSVPVQPQVVVVPSYNLTVVPVYQTQQTTIHQPPPPPAPARQAPPAPVYQTPAPVCDTIPAQPAFAPPPGSVRVIPGYPDPNCGKLYTLQIGAYSTANAADKAQALIRNQGFNVRQELNGPYYRVILSGVQASTIYALVQRLGAIGVEEIIIR